MKFTNGLYFYISNRDHNNVNVCAYNMNYNIYTSSYTNKFTLKNSKINSVQVTHF